MEGSGLWVCCEAPCIVQIVYYVSMYLCTMYQHSDSVMSTMISVTRRTDDTCPNMKATVEQTGSPNVAKLPPECCRCKWLNKCRWLPTASRLTAPPIREVSELAVQTGERCGDERETFCALKSYTGVCDL